LFLNLGLKGKRFFTFDDSHAEYVEHIFRNLLFFTN
jgi:hypothetical protein